MDRIGIGILGTGVRGGWCLARALCQSWPHHKLRIAAIADTAPQRLEDANRFIRGLHDSHGLKADYHVYSHGDALIADPSVDLVLITTPQDQHESPFQTAVEAGKLVYCDKPLAASEEACERMYELWRQHQPRAIVGFTRRYEPGWVKVKQLIDEGAVGQPHMLMLRSVIPFSHYFGGWWRKASRSGDLLNEKCAHHFDVLNWYTGSLPDQIFAVGGRRVFTPRLGYPERCGDCSRTCPYRRGGIQADAPDQVNGFRMHYQEDPAGRLSRDLCVYSPEADILDHAIVNMRFRNGMTAALFFAVFGQKTDDQETIEIVGDAGKLVLTRHTGMVELVSNFGETRATYDCRGTHHGLTHFGADNQLIQTLSRFTHDGVEPTATLEDSYLASKIAFSAQRSLATGEVETPSFPVRSTVTA